MVNIYKRTIIQENGHSVVLYTTQFMCIWGKIIFVHRVSVSIWYDVLKNIYTEQRCYMLPCSQIYSSPILHDGGRSLLQDVGNHTSNIPEDRGRNAHSCENLKPHVHFALPSQIDEIFEVLTEYLWRLHISGMWRIVLKKLTDVSKEYDASIFTVFFDMKLEASRFSETPRNTLSK
jgi:hypothetical protein